MKSITIRFKDGVPVSNAKDPKTRRESEAFGAAFLKAAKEGRPSPLCPECKGTACFYDDPRFPADAFDPVNGMRKRELFVPELLTCGFSFAEAWSVELGQRQSYLSPLRHVVEPVIYGKLERKAPLLPHEESWWAPRWEAIQRRYEERAARRASGC